MRLIFASLLLLAACDPEPLDTSLQKTTLYGSVRVLSLVEGAAAVDALTTVKGELPVGFTGVASPGVAKFRPQPTGDAKAFLTLEGNTLASAESKVEKDATYTLVVTGKTASAATPAPSVTWLKETFEASATKAKVRFALGFSTLPITNVKLGADIVAASPAYGTLGAWVEVAAGTPTIDVLDGEALVAKFVLPALAAGDLRTLVLLPGTETIAARLLAIAEKADGSFTTATFDPEGTIKPKAMVRFIHAGKGVGAVDVKANVTVATGIDLKGIGAYVKVETDSTITVKSGADEVAILALEGKLEENADHTIVLVGNKDSAAGVKLVVWKDDRARKTEATARLANAVGGIPGTLKMLNADTTVLLPGALSGAATAYQGVPAGPSTSAIELEFSLGGPARKSTLATVENLTFPADKPVTVLLYGAFTQAAPPAQPTFEASVLVIDDYENSLITELTPIAATPPSPP